MNNSLRKLWYSVFLWNLPKKTAHKIIYRRAMKKKLDLDNPKDYNEKIQYLMLNYGERETNCTDKYKVREYIKEKGLEDILPKLYGVYKDANEIKWDELPEQFVLKTNHGCACTIICKNKSELDKKQTIDKLNKSLKQNYAKLTLEYHYSNIEPRIICEEYLHESEQRLLPLDYKILCFSGKPECVLVCSDRESKVKRKYYDINWNKLNYLKETSKNEFEKPKNWNEMLEIAKILSKDFPFVRVDLYNINGKIYFGELTFSPDAGINQSLKKEALDYFGSLINLNDINKIEA